ncbi:high light inducible protein [Synechococcus phage S-SRM01]|uniref:High light inducible protein n=1 Tax=Synechococcus phage S-SRM01 TaxID=2781608 RepID=A0A879R2P3_9CAUD|nr:high light inducible protein [Synechococcus phage S-SRM01]QPX48281.1 high light inducible protein [Synechococcus phage S-SRM01]
MDKIFTEAAERLNGRAAMIGFIVAIGTYLTTGKIIPGVW